MVAVEFLNSEALGFDIQIFDFENFDFEVGNWKIEAENRNLSFAAEISHMTVVLAYVNIGSVSAIQVFDSLVGVL